MYNDGSTSNTYNVRVDGGGSNITYNGAPLGEEGLDRFAALFGTSLRLPQGGAPTGGGGGGDAAPTGGGSSAGVAPAPPALAPRPNVVPTNTTAAPEEEKNEEVNSLQSNQDFSVGGSATSKEVLVEDAEEEEKQEVEEEEEPLVPASIRPRPSSQHPIQFVVVDQQGNSSPVVSASSATVVTCNVDNEEGEGDDDGEQGDDNLSTTQSEDLI